jgi:hypothetical protein
MEEERDKTADELASVQADLARAREELDVLRARADDAIELETARVEIADLIQRCQAAERERDQFRGELREAQRVLDEAQHDVEAAGLPEQDRAELTTFFAEWRALMVGPVNRRRYSNRLYELAFILHGHSPAGCEVLRQVLALPCRQCLQDHFRADMTCERMELGDAGLMRQRLLSYCTRYGVNPTGFPVVVASDATGISDTGLRGTSACAFSFGVFPLDATKPILWTHTAPSQKGSHGSIPDEEAAPIDACEAVGMGHVLGT